MERLHATRKKRINSGDRQPRSGTI